MRWDNTLGVFPAHWQMERSDRTCQKVEPEMEIASWAIIKLADLGCQQTIENKKVFLYHVPNWPSWVILKGLMNQTVVLPA